MNKRTANYLSHAENRIRICQANRLLFTAKGDDKQVQAAAKGVYEWIGRAQDQHQENHF